MLWGAVGAGRHLARQPLPSLQECVNEYGSTSIVKHLNAHLSPCPIRDYNYKGTQNDNKGMLNGQKRVQNPITRYKMTMENAATVLHRLQSECLAPG